MSLSDVAGNQAEFSGSFVVDLTKPEISEFAFEKTPTNNQQPLLSAAYSDALSGVDPDMIFLALDGVAVISGIQWTEEGLEYTPETLLEEGIHTASLEIYDKAGNTSVASAQVEIDLTPPPAPVIEGIERSEDVVTMWGDTTPDIVDVVATADGAEVASAEIMSWQVVFRNTGSAQFNYSIQLVDAAGNIGPALTGTEHFEAAGPGLSRENIILELVDKEVLDGIQATNAETVELIVKVEYGADSVSYTLWIADHETGVIVNGISGKLTGSLMEQVELPVPEGRFDIGGHFEASDGTSDDIELDEPFPFIVDRTGPEIDITVPEDIRTWPVWFLYLNGRPASADDEGGHNDNLRNRGRLVYSRDGIIPAGTVYDAETPLLPWINYRLYDFGMAGINPYPFGSLYKYLDDPDSLYHPVSIWDSDRDTEIDSAAPIGEDLSFEILHLGNYLEGPPETWLEDHG